MYKCMIQVYVYRIHTFQIVYILIYHKIRICCSSSTWYKQVLVIQQWPKMSKTVLLFKSEIKSQPRRISPGKLKCLQMSSFSACVELYWLINYHMYQEKWNLQMNDWCYFKYDVMWTFSNLGTLKFIFRMHWWMWGLLYCDFDF